MPYLNIPNSTFGPSIGKVIGRVKGELVGKAQKEILKIVEEVQEGICDRKDRIEDIKKRKDSINKKIISVQKRIQKIQDIVTPLLAAVATFKAIITLLKLLPIPTTPFITIGVTNQFSEKLELAKEFITQIEDDVNSILLIISGAAGVLLIVQRLLDRLNVIDNVLQGCSEDETPNTDDILEVQQEGDIGNGVYYIGANGVKYFLEVKIVEDPTLIAPLRFVTAKDTRDNRIVINGEKSYSSSSDILVEEVKFRIDTELT